jgi:hypothetical protein
VTLRTHLAILLTTALLLACDPAKPKGGDPAASTNAAGTAAQQADPEEDTPLGLAHPDNDTILVGLARGALDSCMWTPRDAVDRNCAQYKAYAAPDAAKGKADTLVRMLKDEDVRVRWLAADSLMLRATAHRTDPALTRAILSSAALEKDPHVIKRLVVVLNNLDTKATNTRDALHDLARNHPEVAFRSEVARLYIQLHPDADGVALTTSLARDDADPGVRVVALGALADVRPPIDKAAVCALIANRISADPHPKVHEVAAYHAFHFDADGGCPDLRDTALSLLEARAASGALVSSSSGKAFDGLLEQEDLDPAFMTRAIAAARAATSNPRNNHLSRANALAFIGRADPDARAFAQKFARNENALVMNQAARILRAPKKK